MTSYNKVVESVCDFRGNMAATSAHGGATAQANHCKDCGLYFDSVKSLDVHLHYHKENLLSKWATARATSGSTSLGDEANNNTSARSRRNANKQQQQQQPPQQTQQEYVDGKGSVSSPCRPSSTSSIGGGYSTATPNPAYYASQPSPYQHDPSRYSPSSTVFRAMGSAQNMRGAPASSPSPTNPHNGTGSHHHTYGQPVFQRQVSASAPEQGHQPLPPPPLFSSDQGYVLGLGSEFSSSSTSAAPATTLPPAPSPNHGGYRFHPYQRPSQPQQPLPTSTSGVDYPGTTARPSSPAQCDKCGHICDSDRALSEHVAATHPPTPAATPPFQGYQHNGKTIKTSNSPAASPEPSSSNGEGDSAEILDLDSHKVHVYQPPDEDEESLMMRNQNPHSVQAMLWSNPHQLIQQQQQQMMIMDMQQMQQQGGTYNASYHQQYIESHQQMMHQFSPLPPQQTVPPPPSSTSPLPPPSSMAPSNNSTWKSNETRRPKSYNCSACNKWFTSSGHLKRHYNTTLHKNAVKQSGVPDPAMASPTSVANNFNHQQHRSAASSPASAPSPGCGDDSFGSSAGGRITPQQPPPMVQQPQQQIQPPMGIMIHPHQYQLAPLVHQVAGPPNRQAGPPEAEMRIPEGLLLQPISNSSQQQDGTGILEYDNQPQYSTERQSHDQQGMMELMYGGNGLIQHQMHPNANPPHVGTHPMNPITANITGRLMEPDLDDIRQSHPFVNDGVFNPLPNFSQFQHQSHVMSGILSHDNIKDVGGNVSEHPQQSYVMLNNNYSIINFEDDMRNQIITKYDPDISSDQTIITNLVAERKFDVSSLTQTDKQYLAQQENVTDTKFDMTLEQRIEPEILDTHGIKYEIPESKFDPTSPISQKTTAGSSVSASGGSLCDELSSPAGTPDHPTSTNGDAADSEVSQTARPLMLTLTASTTTSSRSKRDTDSSRVSSTTSVFNSSMISNGDFHMCLDCDKVFNKACYLTQHNKSFHSGHKPYKCNRCGKRFVTEALYQEHLGKHAGDKPYKCGTCPKQFNHKTDLRRHMCLHTGEKPYTCDLCGKGFIRKDHMLKHCETHRKKVPNHQSLHHSQVLHSQVVVAAQ